MTILNGTREGFDHIYRVRTDEEWGPEGLENYKHEHYVEIEGVEYHVDFTPYAIMSVDDVRAWIDLGMPGRVTLPNGVSANWNSDLLREAWIAKYN
jgi:hypothetical protein